MPVAAILVGTFVLWIAAKGELATYIGFATKKHSGAATVTGAQAPAAPLPPNVGTVSPVTPVVRRDSPLAARLIGFNRFPAL